MGCRALLTATALLATLGLSRISGLAQSPGPAPAFCRSVKPASIQMP